MNQIKFRCWYDKNMEYFYDLYWFEENGVHKVFDRRSIESHLDGLAIMQFIGTCDKNDKEIYEDDIVLDISDNSKWRVEFCNSHECCGFRLFNVSECERTPDSWAVLEVIGNIHENPELMGEK